MINEHNHKNGEQMADTQTVSSSPPYDYKRIALARQLVILAIGLNILVLSDVFILPLLLGSSAVDFLAMLLGGYIAHATIGLFRMGTSIVTLLGLISLTRSLRYGIGIVILSAICAFIPFINIFVLAIMNGRATECLREAMETPKPITAPTTE